MFNILLEWQFALALSPLAKLWSGPSPAAEYINLSVIQNLQIKHRGRRMENENVNLTGESICGSFALRKEEISTSAFFFSVFVTFIICLLSNKWMKGGDCAREGAGIEPERLYLKSFWTYVYIIEHSLIMYFSFKGWKLPTLQMVWLRPFFCCFCNVQMRNSLKKIKTMW